MATSIKLASVVGVGNNNLKASNLYTPRSRVYVEANNTLGPLEDSTQGTDNSFSLNTISAGSTATVRVPPTYPLIREAVLNMKVRHLYTIDTAQPDTQPDCTYLAYRMLRAFTYRLGNADKVRFEAYNMPFIINDGCDTEKKREALLESAGECGHYIPANTATRYWDYNWSIILPLPSSGASLWKKNKPLPIYMCNQSLELEFEWEQAANVNNLITSGPSSTMTVQEASVKIVYESLGSANQLKAAPYLYPFDYIQHMTYPTKLQISASETSKYQVVPSLPAGQEFGSLYGGFTMDGLRDGETTQITFRVAKKDPVYLPQSFTHSTGTTHVYTPTQSTQRCNDIYDGLKLSKIEVLFGGQSIYQANYKGLTQVFEQIYNYLPSQLPGRKREITNGSYLRYPAYGAIARANTASATAITNGVTGDVAAMGDGLGAVAGRGEALNIRSQTLITEPFQLKNRYANSSIASGTNKNWGNHYIREGRPAGFYYHIPVADILSHVRGQDYALGADFTKGQIVVNFVVDSDWYRENGQGYWVEASNVANAWNGQIVSDIDAGTPALYATLPDPDMAATADIIDGLRWVSAGQKDERYQAYTMIYTNGIYHFSGQNVQRIS